MNRFHFECTDCGKSFNENEVEYLCPDCSKNFDKTKPLPGILKIVYDYDFVKKKMAGDHKNGAWGKYLWPLKYCNGLTEITPIHRFSSLEKEFGIKKIWLKNDTNQLSCSYKDRASKLIVKLAEYKKKKAVITASTGNAAASLAAISAFEGLKSIVIVPAKTRPAKLVQMAVYGASVFPVEGSYDDAFRISLELSEKSNFYNRNTAYNPFTIEGKKSSAFEIWEQIGYKEPNVVLIPTGDGVILSGIAKGFDELKILGLIKKIPRLVAVQPEHSNSIYLGWSQKQKDPVIIQNAESVADSLVVNAPRCGKMAIESINKSNGCAVTVSDNEILQSISYLGKNTGIFAEPAAASTIAALNKLIRSKFIDQNETVVLMITGNGLKDIVNAEKSVIIPKPVKNDYRYILKQLEKENI